MAKTQTASGPDTIVCSSCWTAMPAKSQFCSACGAQVSSTVTGTARLAALLSEANLFRMRARWLDAENRCIEAMRLDPNNVDAHSLLGDIYRDQGKLPEAAQWYQLALDLNPDSIGDRTKLSEVEKQMHKKPIDLGVVKAAAPAASPYGTQKLLGLPPNTWLQAITAVAVIFVVIVIGVAITMRRGTPQAETITVPKAPSGPVGSPMPTSGAPIASTPRSTGQTPTPVVPNNQLNAGPAFEEEPSEQETSREEPADPAGQPVRPIRALQPAATDYEKTLRKFIIERAQLSREASIGVVTVDPRHPRASIVISIAPRRSDTTAVRGIALRTATKVALAAFAGDSVLNTVTLNVRLKSGSDRHLPVFAGDADRAAAQSLPQNASFEQLMAAYTSYWWAAAYAPPGLPAVLNAPNPAGQAP